jgi:ketol-acid reductoisomerase
MASKNATRALRASLRQIKTPQVSQRTFITAANASRPSLVPAQKIAASAFVQQTRGKKTVDFAGDKEVVFGEQQYLQWRNDRR